MKNKKLSSFLKKDRLYIRLVILLAATGLCFTCIYFYDNERKIDTDENGQKILERKEDGEVSSYDLEVNINGVKREIEVPVSARQYTEEEVEEMFEKSKGELEEIILGENKSLDEVRSSLNLIAEIPDTGISVSWTTDDHDVLDGQGNICKENVPEEGVLIKLTAVLSYRDDTTVYEFYARIYPPELGPDEQMMKKLLEQMKESDEETISEKYMILPKEVDGEKIEWNYKKNTRAFAILVIGAGMCCMVIVSGSQRKRERDKREIRQMKIDYPQIINKFNLYIRAGMTLRKAWFLIVNDYERKGKNIRRVYEEMAVSMHQMQGGTPEAEVYENFGMRCGISAYRKFGAMLAQNVKKGSKGLTVLLEREAEEAIEERKNLAKKLGEETGTKLMIPMFLMLIIVFAIVIIPAFFSIQI